ncbi:MAG: site-specific integrase, partial [Phycisphaerae bacterium]|nr:site-specific integrase [Phycisphaerae bacterium]
MPGHSRLRDAPGAVGGFLDYLQAECGLALNTRLAYGRDLRRLLEFLGRRRCRLKDLTARDIEEFLRAGKDAGLSVASVARALAAVRMFCRYLVLQSVLTKDVSAILESPKKWNRLPTVLDDSAARTLIGAPQADSDAHAPRDRAILAMLYATGMRAAEVAHLAVRDVNVPLGIVRVMGKGGKERIVPVALQATAAVREYLTNHRPAVVTEGSEERLFLS